MPSVNLYQQLLNCDLNQSLVIRYLFKIRGMRQRLSTINDITRIGFIKLDEDPGREILFGMVSNSPTFSGCEVIKSPSEFIEQTSNDIIKAVINFRVTDELSNQFVSTETRVWCGNKINKKFRLYWFFIKPFSGLVRKMMLYQIKKQLNQNQDLRV